MQLQSSKGVQQHEVNAAADALLAQKVRPTVERVRLRIGHGSPNTVGPMLEHWFADLAPRLGLAASDAGQKLPPQLLEAAQGIWKAALDQATKQVQAGLASESERLAALADTLEQRQKDLMLKEQGAAERERLHQQAAERAQRLHDESRVQIGQLQLALEQRDQALARARDGTESALAEKDAAARDASRRMDALSGELVRLQQRAEGNERRLLEDIDRARQEKKVAEKVAAGVSQRMERAQASAAQHQAKLVAQVRQLELARATIAERLQASEQRSGELQVRLQLALTAAEGDRRLRDPRRALQRKAVPGSRNVPSIRQAGRRP
jgi:DNA repair exonuclease SbcCD ATPase subunit